MKKRYIITTIVFLIVIFGLFGCEKTKKTGYDCYFVPDNNDCFVEQFDKSVFEISGEVDIKENMEDIQLCFGGQEYLCKYEKTMDCYVGKSDIYELFIKEGNKKVGKIAFKALSGNIHYIDFEETKGEDEEKSQSILSQDECQNIIKEVIADINSNINLEDYIMDVTENSKREKYEFTFYKMIDDCYTSDEISIDISFYGDIEHILVGRTGEFNDIDQLDFAKIWQIVEKQLNENSRYQIKTLNVGDRKVINKNDNYGKYVEFPVEIEYDTELLNNTTCNILVQFGLNNSDIISYVSGNSNV